MGQMTPILEDVRRQDTGGARATSELHDEFLGRTMRCPPGIAFVWHDLLIDEGRDSRGNLAPSGQVYGIGRTREWVICHVRILAYAGRARSRAPTTSSVDITSANNAHMLFRVALCSAPLSAA